MKILLALTLFFTLVASSSVKDSMKLHVMEREKNKANTESMIQDMNNQVTELKEASPPQS